MIVKFINELQIYSIPVHNFHLIFVNSISFVDNLLIAMIKIDLGNFICYSFVLTFWVVFSSACLSGPAQANTIVLEVCHRAFSSFFPFLSKTNLNKVAHCV